jgi:hypothetical protein
MQSVEHLSGDTTEYAYTPADRLESKVRTGQVAYSWYYKLLCCKEGRRCGITPSGEDAYAREPIYSSRKTCLPHRLTNTPHLLTPQKPRRVPMPLWAHAACVAQGRVCGRHGTPVDCGDASRAGTRFRCAVVSAVACQGASGWGTHGRSARVWLLADAGVDGRDVDWTDVVPPIRRGGRLRAWSRVLRAEIVARVKASGLYGQRWKVETVISVIKRKFGDGVRSRKLWLARREVLAKGVVYNLHRCFFVVVRVWCVWWALRGGRR